MNNLLNSAFATSELIATSVMNSFAYGFEQLNKKPEPLYNAKFLDINEIASPTGPGWVVNGKLFVKSVEATNRNYLISGNSGSKKSVTIACQLLQAHGQSFCIHDPSGSLANISARYLRRRGYKVFILDFNSPLTSCGVNILDFVKSPSDAGKIASGLVLATLGDKAQDKFWEVACVGLLRLLISIVCKLEPGLRHIKNVQTLLFAFASNRDSLQPLVVKYLSDTEFAEYMALLNGNEKTIASIIATCQSSLEILNSDDVAKICSHSSFNFEEFRDEPTALFIKNSTMDSIFYRPILSLIVMNAIKVFMSTLYQPGQRQIQCILDETNSLRIHGESFESILSNCRKHNLGICCIYQHAGQALAHLGINAGNALLSNCYSKLFMSSDLATSVELEQLIGKTTVVDSNGRERIEPLLPAQKIRLLQNDEAIFVYGSKPYTVKIHPFFDQPFIALRAGNDEYIPEPNGISKPSIINLQ